MKTEMEIAQEVKAFIHKYVDVSSDEEALMTLYALMTWRPLPRELKYLQFVGTYGTGKTSIGRVMEFICYKPVALALGSVGPSALMFRLNEEHSCTLILDEADLNRLAGSSTIGKMLNVGVTKGNAFFR